MLPYPPMRYSSLSTAKKLLLMSAIVVVAFSSTTASTFAAAGPFVDPMGSACYAFPQINLPLIGDTRMRTCASTTATACTLIRNLFGGRFCLFWEATEAACTARCDRCGNGVLNADEDEQCDDGNRDNGDGCNRSCQFEQLYCCEGGVQKALSPAELESNYMTYVAPGGNYLGNGCELIFDGPNARFDFNAQTTLDQTEACLCGNGAIDGFEQCDLGRASDGTNRNRDEYGCTNQCKMVCGDVFVDDALVVDYLNPTDWAYGGPQGILTEACDDGNAVDNDDCDNYCQTCGNGKLDGDEQCDLGRKADGSSYNVPEEGCTEECKFMCGNGNVDNSYVVEDGGTTWAVNDAGDYVKEVCDDGNLENGDGCDWNCQEEVGACCLAPAVAESLGIRAGLATTSSLCGVMYGGTYNDPNLVGEDPVTDDIARDYCARTADDLYCCGPTEPFEPIKIDPAKGTSCADSEEDVYTLGSYMNLATATKACKPVYCEDGNCELRPKFACSAGYDLDWTPPANSRHLRCVNEAAGDNIAQKFCRYWKDPVYLELDCADQEAAAPAGPGGPAGPGAPAP